MWASAATFPRSDGTCSKSRSYKQKERPLYRRPQSLRWTRTITGVSRKLIWHGRDRAKNRGLWRLEKLRGLRGRYRRARQTSPTNNGNYWRPLSVSIEVAAAPSSWSRVPIRVLGWPTLVAIVSPSRRPTAISSTLPPRNCSTLSGRPRASYEGSPRRVGFGTQARSGQGRRRPRGRCRFSCATRRVTNRA